MNTAHTAAMSTAAQLVSPKREVLAREMLSLAKMASTLAVPFLLVSLLLV